MTLDFAEDFTDACFREGVPYLVLVGNREASAAKVYDGLGGWRDVAGEAFRYELISALEESGVFDGGEQVGGDG